MKKAVIAVALFVAVWGGNVSLGAPLRFEKVTDHCYYLQLKEGGENVGAIVTEEGILVVDPPSEPDLSSTVDALKRLSSKAVRWVVFSNPRAARSSGARFFAERGAMLLAGARQRILSTSVPAPPAESGTKAAQNGSDLPLYPWLVFDHQMHLFPANLEIRIMALEHKAVTGGDVVVHVPAEKVLFVGGLCEAARYPEIDSAAQGNASEWVDGLKQVVDSVPVLKPAIPPAKPLVPQPKPVLPAAKTDSKIEPEKKLEEGILVISARGEVSNLQNMKDLLSASQKLRTNMSRGIKAGRTCDNIVDSVRAENYGGYSNFSFYASQLCEALASSPQRNR